MKKLCDKSFKLFLIFSILFTNFFSIIPVLADETVNSGDIRNEVITAGSLDSAGNIKITKTISKTDENGVYHVDFKVEGNEISSDVPNTKNVYTVVVFDSSTSMENYCIGGLTDEHYGRGIRESCFLASNELVLKWKNAVTGTKNFATTLLSKSSNAQIGLVTYANNANIARGLSNSNLNNASYGTPSGSNNLNDGLTKAKGLLDNITGDVIKNIVVISDGGVANNSRETTYATAESIKNSGIELFTIGYDISNGSNDETILKRIASKNGNYSSASVNNVTSTLNSVAREIGKSYAGTSATLTDTIGENFDYVEDTATNSATINGKTISFNVGAVKETSKTYGFDIKIDVDSITGWNKTNNGFNLKYTDSNNVSGKELSTTGSSEVYWEQQKYNYTINYYKDEIDTDNLITTETGSDVLNAVVPISDIEETGYEYTGDITSITLGKQDNILNIIYTKKSYNYTIEYHYNNIKNSNKTEGGSAKFDSTVSVTTEQKNSNLVRGYLFTETNPTDGSIKICPYEEQNVIKVHYSKMTNIPYIVNYYKNEGNVTTLIKKDENTATFEDEIDIDEEKYLPDGYEYNGDDITFEIDIENNIVNITYDKITNIPYTINYYKDSISTDNYLNKVEGTATFEDDIDVDEEKYLPDGYKYNGDDITLEINTENNTINIVYAIKNDLTYRVEYYIDDIIDSSKTDYYTNITYGTVIDTYTNKLPDGYIYTGDTAPLTIKDTNDNIIKVYYNKKYEGDVKPPKTGLINNNTNYISMFFIMSSLGYCIFKKKQEN